MIWAEGGAKAGFKNQNVGGLVGGINKLCFVKKQGGAWLDLGEKDDSDPDGDMKCVWREGATQRTRRPAG